METLSQPEPILIVEDSPTQRMQLQYSLEKHGFQVTAAANGRRALEALVASQPALVISDIQMPEMDGYELCRRINADPALRAIPVILLTSLSAPEDVIRGLECGADYFVVKPYDEEFLLARIHTVLASRQLDGPTELESRVIPIYLAGQRYEIAADRRQILNLLLSTYETAVKTNSDLIKAHEALKTAQAQLIEAEKLQSVGRLAAGVAHEVRNPLAILDMGVACLADQPLDEMGRIVFDEMKVAVQRANDVIGKLMDLGSADEAGMRAVAIPPLIDRALGALREELASGRIAVIRDFAPDLPETPADAAKIQQLLLNLFTNALHAMPDGGTLAVTARTHLLDADAVAFDAGNRGGAAFREGDRVIELEVADTGSGIAPENLGKLYEPFFSTKPTGQGLGLGLTVAKKIVDLHRGRISVANRDGGGAAVVLTFKAA